MVVANGPPRNFQKKPAVFRFNQHRGSTKWRLLPKPIFSTMPQNPSDPEFLQGMSPEQIKQVESLQHALAESNLRGQRFEADWSKLFDQNKTLREENHRLQLGYENLRIQKGGFGFKMLLLSGMGGFFTALVLCFVYLKLKPKDPHTVALQNFRREHQFEYELALSRKQYHEVKISLAKAIQHSDYKPIKADLEIIRELVEAAEKGAVGH